MKWGRCKRPENRPYVESQVRPHKTGLEHDFSSDLLDKPVDTAYGPYADNFPEAQHKYGLFQPIRTELERLKAEKDKIQDKAR
jgi:thiosulfate dehydrogenase